MAGAGVLSRRHFLFSSALSPLAAIPSVRDRTGFRLVDERWLDGPPIHLFGDSIARGYALGAFADDVPDTHPLYDFRSIASMANLVLRDNGHGDLVSFIGLAVGEESRPRSIELKIDDGTVRAGDIVVFADAGDYRDGPTAYQEEIAELRRVATERHDVTCVLMTMFDYPPAGPEFQFDLPVEGMTRNEAIRAAATEEKPYVGQTVLIDLNAEMDAWRSLARKDGIDVVLHDGIHPNVWGQMLITGEILKAAGFGEYLERAETAAAIAQRNWEELAYGSRRFSRKKAERFVTHCLLR